MRLVKLRILGEWMWQISRCFKIGLACKTAGGSASFYLLPMTHDLDTFDTGIEG